MAVEALNCPMCGASVKSDAPLCEHCGTRLATVSCPSCFGLMFQGARFCSHCGARADRTQQSATPCRCPRCKLLLDAVQVGTVTLLECGKCQGVWADTLSLEQICNNTDNRSALLGPASPVATATAQLETDIRYLPCPLCKKLMNRVNFARCSQVVVDVCKGHGTWFDRDELRGIVEFIQSGGLEAARARELREMEEKRRRQRSEQVASAWNTRRQPFDIEDGQTQMGVFTAARVLLDLFRR